MRKTFLALLCTVFVLSAFPMKAVPCEPPPPPMLECRVTGGGNSVNEYWDETMAYGRSRNANGALDHYTFGGQAGAPTANEEQPWGEWTHHQQRGPQGQFVFHAGTASAPEGTYIHWIACCDEGGCKPSGQPPSPAKQIDFGGVGTFKNIRDDGNPALDGVVVGETLHYFVVNIDDLGEPGKSGKQNPSNNCPEVGFDCGDESDKCGCADFYRITIYEDVTDTGEIIYMVEGYIKGGNLQIHYPIQH